MKLLFLGLITIAGLFSASVASAITFSSISADYHAASISDGFTYNNYYYGADALTVAPSFGGHLASSLTFDSSITSSFTGSAYVAQVIDWNFTTGSITLTPNNSTLVYGMFTFTNGQLTNTFTAFSQDHSLPVWLDFTLAYGNISITAKDHELGVTKSGINGPWVSSAVAAVPEPETYAMLFAGLGLISVISRRNK